MTPLPDAGAVLKSVTSGEVDFGFLAIERERRLKSQRPDANIVLTVGSNRVLRTQEEIRLFYAESVTGASQH